MESKVNFISCGYNGNGVSAMVSLEKRIRNEVKVVNRIVFNCGDNCQRICSEKRLKLHTVNSIIITSLAPHNISGFPGLFLALSDLGVGELTVYGPVGTKAYLDVMLPFINRKHPAMVVVQVEDPATYRIKGGSLALTPVYTVEEPRKMVAISASLQPLDTERFDFVAHDSSHCPTMAFLPTPYYFSTFPTLSELVKEVSSHRPEAQELLLVFIPLAVASHDNNKLTTTSHIYDAEDEEEDANHPELESPSKPAAEEVTRLIRKTVGSVGIVLPNVLDGYEVELQQAQIALSLYNRLTPLAFSAAPLPALANATVSTKQLDGDENEEELMIIGRRLYASPAMEVTVQLSSPDCSSEGERKMITVIRHATVHEISQKVDMKLQRLPLDYPTRGQAGPDNVEDPGEQEADVEVEDLNQTAAEHLRRSLNNKRKLSIPQLLSSDSCEKVDMLQAYEHSHAQPPALVNHHPLRLELQLDLPDPSTAPSPAGPDTFTSLTSMTSMRPSPYRTMRTGGLDGSASPAKISRGVMHPPPISALLPPPMAPLLPPPPSLLHTISAGVNDGNMLSQLSSSSIRSLHHHPPPPPFQHSNSGHSQQRLISPADTIRSLSSSTVDHNGSSRDLLRHATESGSDDDIDPDAAQRGEEGTILTASQLPPAEYLQLSAPLPTDCIRVTFLGTGCATPSRYRSNAAIALTLLTPNHSPGADTNDGDVEYDSNSDMSSSPSVLLDCGEGAAAQLFLACGGDVQKFDNALLSLRVIWISHHHADHATGLPMLLHHIQRAALRLRRSLRVRSMRSTLSRLHRSAPPAQFDRYALRDGLFQSVALPDRILLVAPEAVLKYCEFALAIAGLDDLVSLFPITNTLYAGCTAEVQAATKGKMVKLTSVSVQHCSSSFGCVMELQSGMKVVYSGDCRPSQSLVKAGINCDLLIHEATFADELAGDAMKKRHCTVSEAKRIAQQMQAKSVVLTHFSQRYMQRVPLAENGLDSSRDGVAFASDFLSFRVPSQVQCLAKLTVAVSQVLEAVNKERRQPRGNSREKESHGK